MNEYEDRPPRLTDEEIFAIFDVIHRRGNLEEAGEEIHRKVHSKRSHRTTVAAVFNVGHELFKRGSNAPDVLTDQEVDEITEKAGYGVSPSRVVRLHRLYHLWKAHKREAELEPEKYPGRKVEMTEMTSLSEKYLIDHYQKLHKVLKQFYGQFRTPKVLELCLFTLKDSVTISYSYVSEMRGPAIVYEKGAVKLDVEVSDPFLWERLQEHLTAEFPELSQNLGDWKRDIAALVEECHDITKTIVGQLAKRSWDSAEPYLDPASKDYGPGVFYHILTDLMYECLIARHLPEFQRVSDSHGLLILVMDHSTGRQSVARGESALLDQVQQHCVKIVRSLARKKRVTKVLDIVGQLDSKQELFRKKMRVVLERGTFKGICSICSDLVGKSG